MSMRIVDTFGQRNRVRPTSQALDEPSRDARATFVMRFEARFEYREVEDAPLDKTRHDLADMIYRFGLPAVQRMFSDEVLMIAHSREKVGDFLYSILRALEPWKNDITDFVGAADKDIRSMEVILHFEARITPGSYNVREVDAAEVGTGMPRFRRELTSNLWRGQERPTGQSDVPAGSRGPEGPGARRFAIRRS